MSTFDLFKLDGKVALVTGGGSGLGKQIVEALADAGCSIAICSRKIENCQATVSELKNLGINANAYRCDISDEEEVIELVSNVIRDFGTIDILINNSGTTWGASVEEMPLSAWEKVFKVNSTGTFLMCREVGKWMVKNKAGKIINISSVAGLKAEPPEILNAIGYSSSKAAVLHFTKDLARKWAQHNIYVNAIAPGFFPTKMTKAVLEKKLDQIINKNPLKRVGDSEALKGAVVYLASSASDFVTGQVITVDGGSSL